MSIALVVLTDGRPYLDECLRSAEKNLKGPIIQKILVEDSGSRCQTPAGWSHVSHFERLGIAAGVNSGWDVAASNPHVDYIFWLEEDFIFDGPVDLEPMLLVLEHNPHLAQIVLRRQPWSEEEKANGTVGGFENSEPRWWENGSSWTEQTHCFSCNPCLIPRRVFERDFTDEVIFGKQLVSEGMKFAFWGTKDDPPRVEHIGVNRSAGWKL